MPELCFMLQEWTANTVPELHSKVGICFICELSLFIITENYDEVVVVNSSVLMA